MKTPSLHHFGLLSAGLASCLLLALVWISGPGVPEAPTSSASPAIEIATPVHTDQAAGAPVVPAPEVKRAVVVAKKAAPAPANLAHQQAGTAWGREANAECRAFSAWANDYAAAPASERTAMETRGVQLAADRREAVKKLITTDPAAALAAAVPMKVRSALPEAIVAKLEQRVSGRGDLTVLATVPAPGQRIESHYRRVASIGGQHYAAHVFGERAEQRTTEHDSLHGIAVDGKLAILESPLRLLEDGEQPSAGKKIVNASTAQHSTTTESAPVFESGDTVYVGCCQQHVAAQQQEWLAASGGSVPASGGPNATAYRTTGNRSILVMVAKLSGGPSMITQAQAQAGIDQIATWAQQASFQQLTFTTKTVTTELTLPKTKSEYQALGDTTGPQTLLTDARAAAVAASAAYDTNNFDFDIVVYESTFAFSGLGTVGGKKCWIQLGTVGQFETSTTAHELGHNLGLNHAGVWVRPSGSTNPIDPAGTFQDYGSLFDALGLGGYPKGHYSVHYKRMLGWVPSANIHTVTSPTTSALRIYAHDTGVSLDPARKYGLRVAVADTVGAGRRDYWMDVRTLYTDRPNSQNGVTLQWGDEKGSPQGSALIDTTPNSNTSQGTLGDFVDAPLGVGSSFTDSTCGVTITPIASGGSGSDKYVDVQVTTPDADLSALALSTGTLSPSFSASTLSYSASVSSSTTSVTVTPTASASSSTIQVRVNGGTFSTVASGTASSALALNPGPNTVDVKVTATGGLWSKTYSVSVSTMPAIAGAGYGPIPETAGTSRDITFTISGLSGTVSNVLVDFTLNPAHTYSSDVKAVLIAPDSTQHVVASFTHLNDNSRLAGPYLFSDLATGTLGAAITATAGGVDVPSGSFRTQNNNETATSLVTTFSGKAPNGTWTLRFTDLWAGDTGTVSAANLYLATTTPAAPELAVFNGASTAAIDERTDNTGTQTFANTSVGSTSSAQTFTVKNTGTADITGLTISKTGDFTITQPAVTTLAPDATTTFTVSFAPTARGTRTGVISIASNDADENPFEINVSGAGLLLPVPVLSYFANGLSVFFNAHNEPLPGAPIPTSGGVVYARTDTNTAPLIGGSGVTNLETELVNSGFDGLSAEFTPGVSFTFRAYLINADGVGYSSPETVTFAPEIAVFNGVSTDAADERTDNTGTFTFANTNVGSTSSAQTFTIKNVGNFALGPLAVTKTGDFTVTQPFGSGVVPSLGGDAYTTFTVTFAPTAAGTRTGVISIASNDADENPFEINVSGTGVVNPPTMYSFQSATPEITSATLSGQVMLDNGSPVTEVGAVLAPTSVNADPQVGGAGVTKVARATPTMDTFSVMAEGLTPGTSYSFRAYGTNAGGTRYSALGTFTTQAALPKLSVEQPAGTALSSSLIAWGSNDFGQTTVPTAAQSGVKAIAARENHTVVLKTDGSVVAWGDNSSGQTTVPTAAQSGVQAIATGDYHTLALKTDGSIIAWGSNDFGQTTVPTTAQSGVQAIAAGRRHTVALKTDGSVVVWGDNGGDQTIVPTAAQSGVKAIAAGTFQTLALKTDGSVVAWGFNLFDWGIVPPAAQSGVQAIAAGTLHTVALKIDGSVVAWGDTSDGKISVPTAAQSGVQAIAAGTYHTVALKIDGSIVAWGDNTAGQRTVPTAAQSGVQAIAAGGLHTVALKMPSVGFGSQLLATTSAAQTFTLKNTGTGPLTISSASVTGGNASDFSVDTGSMASSIAPGDSTTVSLTFTPSAVGPRQTTLRIVSNDSTASTFDIVLTGTGSGVPEIAVFNGTSTAAGDERTDNIGTQTFANTVVGNTSSAQTFTLKNTGTADLTGLVITNTGDFTITQPAVTTLAPDATTTFTVSFVPTATGTRTGVISIASNDADENPFDINVSGTGVELTHPEIAVFNGRNTDAANERTDNTGTLNFVNTIVGTGSAAQTFTIKNTGVDPLIGLVVTKTGDFALTQPMLTTLAPNATTTFTVAFTPTAEGTRSGVISIASNDADENPFEINVTGEGLSGAAEWVTFASNITPTGADLNADVIEFSFPYQLGFLISATALNDNPQFGESGVQIALNTNSAFQLFYISGAIANLVPGTSYSVRAFKRLPSEPENYTTGPVTTFTTPASDGSAAQEIAIIHPDHLAEGAMFTIDDMANGGSYAFGSHVGVFPIIRTIGIANRGDSPLVISSIAFTAESSPVFSLTAPTLPLTIPAHGVISVPMSFAPPADAATFSATLRVLSNDTDEATTEIAITGERVIQAPTVTTPIGTALTLEKARFTASVPLDGGRPVTERGFTYRVSGSGVRTTLVVPGTTGEFSAVVDHIPPILGIVFVRAYAINSVGTTYSDEFYYDIPEFVPGPTIAVFKGESTAGDLLADNVGTQSLGELLVGGTTTQTFTIKNTGTEELTGLTLEKDGSHATDFTSTALVGTLAPDATTTITITFSPGATGTRSASFAIGTPDTALNPFEINVTGTGVATPTVTTPTVTNITPGRATLGGTIESDGGSPITERGIVWTNSNAGQEQVIGGVGAHQIIASGTDTGVFTVDVSGFTGGGVFFKAYAKNANVTSYSSVSTFLSQAPVPTLVLENPAAGTDYTASAAARTFTLRNTGTQTLTISGVILQGSNPDSFVLDTTGMATTLAASATTTFTLAAAPNVRGGVSAQLVVTSDDAGQPSLARNVSGYGALPLRVEFTDEIGTRLRPTSAPVTATPTSYITGAEDGGFVLSLASVNGLPEIGGTGVTLGGEAVVLFGIYLNCQTLFTDLLPGQDYVVRPYVHFTGNATPFYGPVVSFKPHFDGPGVILLGEDGKELTSLDFPLQALGTSSVTRVLTLRNEGDQPAANIHFGIELYHDPIVNQFSLPLGWPVHLEPGEQSTFTMTFRPTSEFSRTTTVGVTCSDETETTSFKVQYPFTASAGAAPEISVFDGTSTDSGERETATGTVAMSAAIGSSVTRTFTVKNVGSTDLTDLALSFSNQSSKDFSFTPPAVTTLAAGDSTTFTVSFAPAVAGTTSAKLRIASNDIDENLFVINFTGTSVAAAPQLLIEQAEGLAIGGFLTAWGTDTDGQITFPSYLANVKQVATGVTHTLALQTNGHVARFGSNDYGERSAPAGLAGVASIAAGDRISVAVKSDGTVAAWGDDSSGAVTALSALTNVKSVDTHDSGSWVALRNDGTVATGGSLGSVPADLPVIKAIASGQHHALALSEDGHVIAWASTNDFGEANVPEGLSNVIAIAAGLQHSMALKQDGTVVVWGGARAAERSVPEGMANVVKIECGEENCIVVHADGTVSTWGPDGFYGTSSPPALQDVTSVSASARHAVAIIGGLKFGTQRVGGDSYLRPIILRNTGSAPLTISDATIIGTHPGDFTIHTAPASPIAPGESSTMAVEFVPTAAGHRMAKLRFNSDDTAQAVVTIPLHGDAIDPKPPTGHDRVLTIQEDESIVLTTNTFGFEDLAQSPQDSPVGIKIITLPAHGTLWNYDVEITEAGVVVPDWNDLSYAPQPDASGSPYDSFTLQLVDSGPSDVNLSTVLTATINVLPSSEPPEGTDKTITVAPNGRHVFTPEEFGFSDPNDTPPNRFKSVMITQFPEAGRLLLNGKPLGYLWFGTEALGAPIGQPDGTVVNFLPVPGNQWTYHGPEHDWQGIASSTDGSKLIAAGSVGNEAALLYTSTDGGQTWNASGNESNYYAVASSADGSVLYAARSHYYQSEGPPSTVLKSTDGGQNWSELPLTGDDFWVLATSANGQVIAAMDGGMWNWTEESGYVHTGGALRLSTDGGATFTTHLLGKELMGVDCSADGQIIVAITQHNFFISKDGGSTWSAEFEGDSNDYNWRAITCSADGQHLFIAASHHGIRVSHDAGTTWTDGGFTGYFLQSIACSDDGKIVIATPDYGRLHVSLNGGETWEMKDEIRYWLSSSVSGDGSRLFAGSQTRTNFYEAGLAAFFEEAVSTDGHIAISSASIDELVYIPGEQRFILAEASSSGTPSDGFIFHVVDDGDPAGNTDLSGNVMAINLGDRLADPIFANLAATNITPTTATLGATLVNEEGAFITDLGFEYHQTVGENTYNYTAYADVTQSGPFTAYVPDVLTNVPVIYRAFATFSDGSTAYSDERSFIPSDSRPLAVGNLVFWDKNNNGHADAGEGIDGVTVQLFGEHQEIGASTSLRTATTANGGFWLIDELPAGSYRLFIPKTMFAEGAPLWKMKSVEGFMIIGDDDIGEKGQDSSEPEEDGVRTDIFALIPGSAPTSELGLQLAAQDEARDIDIDLTRDFGFVDRTEKDESFNKWKQRNGGGSGDDHRDLINYALGGDDGSDTTTHFDVDDDHQTDQTHIRLRRRHGSQPDVTYTVQVCPDLSGARGTWEGTTILPTIVNNGDGTEDVTFPDVTRDPALQGEPLGFTRLVVKLLNPDGSVAQTSISDILGWQHRPLEVRTQTYGLPFVRPAVFTGTVASTDGGSITLATGSDVGATLQPGEHYYVEVIKGDQEGQRYEVMESGTSATHIALSLVDPLSTQKVVPATLASDTIAVRPHWRVKDLFPPADYTAGTGALNSDQVQLWDAAQGKFIPLFLGDHPTLGRMWVIVGDSASQNDRIVGPADGLFVKPRQSLIAAADGQVRTWKFACPLLAGTNLIGNPYPVAQSFSSRQMTLANGFTGNASASAADRVNAWSGDTSGVITPGYVPYTLAPTGVWVKIGEFPQVDRSSSPVFDVGTASFINSKVANPGWIMPAAIAP